jgi:TAG lipase / steryl ester hydrolase / phospholipase A2 / LPA acyltransferase
MFAPEELLKTPMIKLKSKGLLQFLKMYYEGKPTICTEALRNFIYIQVGDLTFNDIYTQFGWNLNISVTEARNADSRLLNYLTAPNVLVWSAVVASCAIPGMFVPMDLMMKTFDGK